MSDKKLDVNDPNYNPFDPENMAGGMSIGLDDRTATVLDARCEDGQYGGQLILTLQADGEDKPWTKWYDAGNKAKANDTGTAFLDEHGNTFTPTKISEVGQFGTALFDAKIKNLGAIARDLSKLIGHRLHFKEVTQYYVQGDKKGKPKQRTFTYKDGHPKAGQKGTADKTIALPVSVVSYPGGVAAGASDVIEAKAREYIVKAIAEAPGGKLAIADTSRTVSKLINGDPDKAGILAKVADKKFLKASGEAFKFDGLTLSL